MANQSYGSTASTSTRTSTVPPPSTSSTRRDVPTPPGPTSSPGSTIRTPRRQRLHRPSIMSLSSHGSSSPRAQLPVSAGSGAGTAPSLGSPYAQTLRHRQSRREDGEDVGDNWASLRDMVSEDDDEEERNDHSDTSTLRPTRTRTEPIRTRPASSVGSVRSFFTARSEVTSVRSGITIRNDSGSAFDGLLSSSPPQMNGFGNMEELLEDESEGSGLRTPESSTTMGNDGVKDVTDENQPLLQGVTKSLPTKSGQLALSFRRARADAQYHGGEAGHHIQ